MDCKMTKEPVTLSEILLSAVYEQTLECDFVLADYYPDIQRILKCEVETKILSKQLSADKLTIDGVNLVQVYYCTPEQQVRCAFQKLPFSKSIELKNAKGKCCCYVSACLNYANVRAVSERRVDVRGAVSLKVKVVCTCTEQVVCDAQGAGVELNRKTTPVSMLLGNTDKYFLLQEDIEIGTAKPPISSVLKCSGRAAVTDYKLIAGKIILKGELNLRTTYLQEDSPTPEVMLNTLPISQIVDIEELGEDCRCSVDIEVITADVAPKQDLDGETRMFTADVNLCAHINSYRDTQITYADDEYSTKYETMHTEKPIKLERVCEQSDESYLVKGILDLSANDLAAVVDIWCQSQVLSVAVEQSRLSIQAKLIANVLMLDSEDSPSIVEKQVEFTYEKDLSIVLEKWECETALQPGDISYTIQSGGQIDLRVQCQVGFLLKQVLEKKMITDLQIDEQSAVSVNRSIPLTIYYADRGEKVWEIAKRYRTCAGKIMEENELESDVMADRAMLLIPIVTS